ncbi:Uncharacterised protein [Mycobacteroides abscessus subsp. abscessus]|nr:Uncharacterised protein [Mycobacteroides abscessus subsp. abscessus]
MEGRRVVEGGVRLDVAEVTHSGRRCLPGIEDVADGVAVPHRVPGAGDRLPVGEPAQERVEDERHPERDAECDGDERGAIL